MDILSWISHCKKSVKTVFRETIFLIRSVLAHFKNNTECKKSKGKRKEVASLIIAIMKGHNDKSIVCKFFDMENVCPETIVG